jgi:hypothetical protein
MKTEGAPRIALTASSDRIHAPRERPSLVCFICAGTIAPHKSVAYLHTGVVVHVPCRNFSRGAVGTTVAIVQPSAHAVQRRVREVRAAASATRATMDQGPMGGS